MDINCKTEHPMECNWSVQIRTGPLDDGESAALFMAQVFRHLSNISSQSSTIPSFPPVTNPFRKKHNHLTFNVTRPCSPFRKNYNVCNSSKYGAVPCPESTWQTQGHRELSGFLSMSCLSRCKRRLWWPLKTPGPRSARSMLTSWSPACPGCQIFLS